MNKYKEGRYTYYIIPEVKMVKCVSTYAKKPYVGVAKCVPEDEFNESLGKYIARTKCDAKISCKRMESLNADLIYVESMIALWNDEKNKVVSLIEKAKHEIFIIASDLNKIENETI